MQVTKSGFRMLVEVLVLAVLVLIIVVHDVENRRTYSALGNVQVAVQYICQTTTVLDELDVAAANQIAENFANGTYIKLKQRGILSEQNIKDARISLKRYQAAHQKLQHNGACSPVLGR